MNKQQLKTFEIVANSMARDMRIDGYLSIDIVTVAYFMLKNNIDDAEGLVSLENDLMEILDKTTKILEVE